MARTTLGDLRSRKDQMYVQNPSEDSIQDLIRRSNEQKNGTPFYQPGYQERNLDPTKVISGLPPSLNAPMPRTAPGTQIAENVKYPDLPAGFSLREENALPPTSTPTSAPPTPRQYNPTPEEVQQRRQNEMFEPLGSQAPLAAQARDVAAERSRQAVMGGSRLQGPAQPTDLTGILNSLSPGAREEILKMIRGPQ